MPRTKLGADTYKDQDLVRLIRRRKYELDLTNRQAAKLIGVSETTWRNYMACPGKIPLNKIRAIQKKLGVPREDMAGYLI